MKTSKRVSALLIAACLLIGMMVPMVSAANYVATKTVTYDFDVAGVVKDDLKQEIDGGTFCFLSTEGSDGKTIDAEVTSLLAELKTKDHINWGFHSFSGNFKKAKYARFHPYGYFWGRGGLNHYVAFTIDNPGLGEWTLTVKNPLSNNGASEIGVYILPSSTENIASALDDNSLMGTYSSFDENSQANDGPLKDTITSTTMTKTWKIEEDADDSYIVVFKVNELNVNSGNRLYLSQLVLTRECTSGEDTVAAMKDAPACSSVWLYDDLQLTSNVTTKADILVRKTANLDLKGNNLGAKLVTVIDGGSVIDSEDGVGLLKTDIAPNGNNGGYLPLTDSEAGGYRLFKVNTQALAIVPDKEDNTKAAYWFHAHFENKDAYDYTGVEIGVQMTWNGGSKDAWAGDTFMGNWATQVKADKDLDIKLTVTGLDTVTNFKLTPVIQANGVTISMEYPA